MNIDSQSPDDILMIVDAPSPVVPSGLPTTTETGVQTDYLPQYGTIDAADYPSLPLEVMEADDLRKLIRSLSSRVSYLRALQGSPRPLPSLRADEIPAEMVAQCIDTVFAGQFDMLVAFGATKHRLLSSGVNPDVKEHVEHLFQRCHTSLSEMLARLDEGRRNAPDVFMESSSSM
ncbi:hypothetical protein B0H16DRAFT_1732718 [Mycena metata]|uniref:Uncharacterized protein n=1 Tax=Mycena metata TaxID=1033252 RepID=A0AAD7MUH4_9AGAR|nr:hypothetical protein B0H16DRAFT_1732718 [Mycena metata]